MELFKIFGRVALTGAETADTQLESVNRKGSGTSKVLQSIGKIAKGAGVAVGAFSAAIGVATTKVAKLTDNIDKMSQKMGVSRKMYQEWDFIFSQSGASVDLLQMSMKTLAKTVSDADQGNEKYLTYFRKLKVDIHDVNGEVKDQETLFNEVFKSLASYGNETERSAMLTQLLGGRATELLPAMNAGAEGIEAMRQEAHDLGLVLGDDVVDAGVKFTDAVDKIKRSMGAMMANAIGPFMPMMTEMAESIIKVVVPALGKFVHNAMRMAQSIQLVFGGMYAIVTIVLHDITKALEGPYAKLKEFLNALVNIPVVKSSIDFLMNLGGKLFEGLAKGARGEGWDDFFKAAFGVADFIIGLMATLQLVAGFGTLAMSLVQSALAGAGFIVPKLGAGSGMALISLGLAISETMITGDTGKLAENVGTALMGGFAAGVLTGNPKLGYMVFTILLSFKAGNKVIDAIKEANREYEGEDPQKIEIQETVIDTEGLFTEWGVLHAARKKLLHIWGTDLGEELLSGLGYGLEDIEKIGEQKGRELLESLKDELGIQSPSTEMIKVGGFIGAGLVQGLEESGMVKGSLAVFDKIKKSIPDMFGIASNSKYTTEIGRFLGGGFVEGLEGKVPGVMDVMDYMAKGLKEIWADPEIVEAPDLATPLEAEAEKVKSIWQKIGDFAKGIWEGIRDISLGIGSEIVGASSVLGGAVQGFMNAQPEAEVDEEGNEKKAELDLTGGLIGMLVSLLSSSEQFADLMEVINPILDEVVGFLGQLLVPLIPIVRIIGKMLTPMLEGLAPVMMLITWLLESVITPIIIGLSNSILWVYNSIATIINWLINAINKIPLVNIRWRMPTQEYISSDSVSGSTSTDEENAKSGGGTQLSEITGPTRDLLVSLLSPLSSLDSLLGIGERIYALLDERLSTGVTIGDVIIYPASGTEIDDEFIAAVEEALGNRATFATGGV